MSTFTDDQLIEMYIASRTACETIDAEADAKKAPHKQRMDSINKLMLSRFAERGATNTKTGSGTAFIEEKDSATVAHPDVFFEFVQRNEAWDLIEKRCAKLAIRSYIDSNKEVPPGINYVVRKEVTFRKPTASSK